MLALLVFVRFGLFALVMLSFFYMRLRAFPITLDGSAWYAGTSTAALLILGALALYAFGISVRGGAPAGGDRSGGRSI